MPNHTRNYDADCIIGIFGEDSEGDGACVRYHVLLPVLLLVKLTIPETCKHGNMMISSWTVSAWKFSRWIG